MDKYEAIVRIISEQTGVAFRPASRGALASLAAFNVPEAVIRFYREHEPARRVEGQVRLLPIEDMVVENTQGVPGVCVQPHGYVVFASTVYGDAYCFNGNKVNAEGEPEIVLVSHEAVQEDSTAEEVHRLVKKVASSLFVFLDQFSEGVIDEDCIY